MSQKRARRFTGMSETGRKKKRLQAALYYARKKNRALRSA